MVAARGVGRRIRLAWLGKRTRLSWLGSQQRRLHKEEAPDRSLVPISNSTHSSVQTLAVQSSARITAGVFSGALASQRVYGTLPWFPKKSGMPTLVSTATAGGNPLASRHTFSTLAGDPSTTNAGKLPTLGLLGDACGNLQDTGVLYFQYGNSQKLCERILAQTGETRIKVLNFEARYNQVIRPQLVSRCLIAPCHMNSPWMVFLKRQTFAITKHNPSYLSCFDIMAYESDNKEVEWEMFLKHLVDRRVYIIEDWESTQSTIQNLMYDHGIKQPDDGTDVPFYKGECDASYDARTKTASLSYMIWKDDKVIYAEAFSGLTFPSATEAEIYAAFALLYKAEELGIQKLYLCSDFRTVTKILTGELPISMNYQHRDLYLTLRSTRFLFKWLIVTWKPRELMFYVDSLSNAVKFQDIDSSKITKIGVAKFSGYLKGQPVFRIERTRDTAIAVKKFGQVRLDDSYGMNDNGTYIVEVEEEYKFDCLVGLLQSLKVKPGHARLEVALHNYPDKSDSFKKQLAAVVGKFSEIRCQSEPIPCSTLVRISSKPVPASTSVSVCPVEEPATPPKPSLKSKSLIVVLDYVVPKDVYYNSGAFHVLFVTPSERASMAEKFPELTALGFVHFHGVRYPLNEDDEAGPSNEEEALVDPVNNE